MKIRKIYFALLIVTCLKTQDISWKPNGLPIRQGVHNDWKTTECTGEPGSINIVWSDTRFGRRKEFPQKVI